MRSVLSNLIGAAALAAALAAPLPAEANWRCGYDRYGYHPPNFRGCDRYWRDAYREYRRYGGDYVIDGYSDLPLYGARVGHRCYYDHAWTNVVRVCY